MRITYEGTHDTSVTAINSSTSSALSRTIASLQLAPIPRLGFEYLVPHSIQGVQTLRTNHSMGNGTQLFLFGVPVRGGHNWWLLLQFSPVLTHEEALKASEPDLPFDAYSIGGCTNHIVWDPTCRQVRYQLLKSHYLAAEKIVGPFKDQGFWFPNILTPRRLPGAVRIIEDHTFQQWTALH